MAMLRWDPWADFSALQRDINEVFSRSGGNGRAPGAAMDAYRTDEAVFVELDLPGIAPGDVEVAVADGLVTITAERKPAPVADDQWLRRERALGLIQRSFSLPKGTDPDAISAGFEHGVLHLRIPHPPERKPRRIPVEGAGSRDHAQMVDVTAQS